MKNDKTKPIEIEPVEELSEALIEMLDKESCHIGQTTTHSWEQYADRLKNIFEQVPEYSMT